MLRGRVIYCCPYVPAEWIEAHGFEPSRIMPRSHEGMPAEVCPYAWSFLNEVLCDQTSAAVILTTRCDQMRRGAEWLMGRTKTPVFLMYIPRTWQTAGSQHYYLDELRRLGEFLVRLGGRRPDDEKLADIMRRYDDARSALRDQQGKLSGREFAQTTARFNADGHIEKMDGCAIRATGIPIAIVGGPMLREDFPIYDLIESSGGRIVLDGSGSGERTWPAKFDRRRLREEPLLTLAEAYFGTISDAFRRPNSELYRWLEIELAKRDVKGIIYRRHVWCDTWNAELGRLRDWTKLPVLDLEVESSGLRNETRIQAFLEALR